MNRFKILMLVNGLSPYRLDFFQELGKKCDLTIVCERKVAGNRSWRLAEYKELSFSLNVLKGFATSPDTALCPSVLQYLSPTKYDMIIVANYSTPTGVLAIAFMKSFSIKFAIECDGGIRKNGKGLKEKIKRMLISSAKWWISPSDMSDIYLMFYGADKSRIFRYPFSSIKKSEISIKLMNSNDKAEIKKILGINERNVVISIGQFIERKGFDVLINACKNLKEQVGVYLIGGIPTAEYIEQVSELNLCNVNFVGFMGKELLDLYYKAADVFVLPTREDIWGLVINEAMAYGLPIVTTDKCVAGLELVKDFENGFIVPAENSSQLADRIDYILTHDQLRESMSQKSIEKISDYTIENMVLYHMKIFEQLIC